MDVKQTPREHCAGEEKQGGPASIAWGKCYHSVLSKLSFSMELTICPRVGQEAEPCRLFRHQAAKKPTANLLFVFLYIFGSSWVSFRCFEMK